MMWLVKLADNWADEMDIEGFAVMSNVEFMDWAQLVEKVALKIDEGHTFEWFIGTNEWIDWDSGSNFKEAFSCDVIADVEAEILKRLLLGNCARYGLFPSMGDMRYFLEDEE